MVAEVVVLDASVAVKALSREAGGDVARHLLLSHPDWIAPDLIYLEVANVFLKQARRGIDLGSAEHALVALSSVLIEVTPASVLYADALSLARRLQLSAYDGAYLALAVSRGGVLHTADARLARAAAASEFDGFIRLLGEPTH